MDDHPVPDAAPAARRDLDRVTPAPDADPADVPAPDAPTWPMAEVDHDPVAEAGRLLGIARQAFDDGVAIDPDARLRPAREALLRALEPVTRVQGRVDDHIIGSVDILVKETRRQWLRTTRLVTGMATVDMALDVTDHQLRALRAEVGAARDEAAAARDQVLALGEALAGLRDDLAALRRELAGPNPASDGTAPAESP